MINGILKKQIKAFTLAEVLITLGIIGMVAAMTIPTVSKKFRNYQLEQQFKKSYSMVSQAILNTKQELNLIGSGEFFKFCTTYNGSSYINTAECRDAFYKKLKITQIKNLYTKAPMNYSNTIAATFNSLGEPNPNYILADGTAILFKINGFNVYISVDINGPAKPPNRAGYDIFNFQLSNKDMINQNSYGGAYPCSKNSSEAINGFNCTQYAIKNINPDDPTKKYWDSLE